VELVDGLRRIFVLKANEKEIGFVVKIVEPVHKLVVGDSLRIRQILTNLLGNALKFTDKGTVSLNVRQLSATDKGIKFEFAVRDSGIGMSAEQLGKLFQPFVQADNSISRRFGGTGLGLNISRNLANLMHGEIRVESEINVGSTFIFEVTLSPVHEDENQTKNLLESETFMQDEKLLVGKRVLLAEDNRINQLVATKLLTKYGLIVDVANNGEEALQLVFKNEYELVFMDIQMPVMDGLAATRQLRQQARFKNLPIIAMSAGVTLEEQSECNAAGMTSFIPKPIDSTLLKLKLYEYLLSKN
jgi:CheY-like chemotaxis protein